MANAGAQAKGRMGFIIDEDELQAKIEFAPDPEGEVWGADRLRQLILEHRVAQGPAQKELEEIISRLSKAKEPVTEVIARGQAPEEPKPEEFDKADVDVPERLKDLAFELVAKSPPPVIYSVKVERSGRENRISPPPSFLPEKGNSGQRERRATRERVAIDTQPSPSAMRRPARARRLYPGQAGKPGSQTCLGNRYSQGRGRRLPLRRGRRSVPARPRPSRQYPGTRDGQIGSTWSPSPRLTLELDEATGSVTLSYDPATPASRARAAEILARSR